MNKRYLKAALFAVVASVAGYGAYQALAQENELSEIALANVEALADDENIECPYGCMQWGDGCYCYVWFPCYKDGPHN